jgi:exopolysaccharide production protein ExoZ
MSHPVRVRSLDSLRGLMALAVMAYHYTGAVFGPQDSGTILGKLGVYAVSVFYILSGVSLAIVYRESIRSSDSVLDYAVKRVFRIFPLFYVVVTSALLLGWLGAVARGAPYSFPAYEALLNYTLTFGFIDPSAYLSTGAWSIGNELVFYAFFPVIVLATRRWPAFLPLSLCAAVAIEIYFAFFALSADVPLEAQWATYIHPFNQLFLFISGMAIGYYLRPAPAGDRRARGLSIAIALLGAVAFAAFPAVGNQAHLVTGGARLFLSALCITFVAAIFVCNAAGHSTVARPLAFLGEGCYSIYLLHPIVAIVIVFGADRLQVPHAVAYPVAFVVTLALSAVTFRFVERPMIGMGREASNRMRRRAGPASA